MLAKLVQKMLLLRTIAFIVGIVFVIIGVMGFMPAFMTKDALFGTFRVNTVHNVIHVVSGIIALWTSLTSREAAKMFFQIFGIVYGIVGVVGFFYGDQMILGLIANNIADAWLHVVLGVVFLFLGFGCCCKERR